MSEQQIIEVWLGAFGEPKPYGPQPGDAWVAARLIARKKSGAVWAKQTEGPFASWIKPEHWRPIA